MTHALRIVLAASALIASMAGPRTASAVITLDQVPPSYDAFGFSYFQGDDLFAVARRGTRHDDDVHASIVTFAVFNGAPVGDRRTGGAVSTWTGVGPHGSDSRNAAGGVTPGGCLALFYGVKGLGADWRRLQMQRFSASPDKYCPPTAQVIPTGADAAYSPYGPLVALPSGRLMQTLYGITSSGAGRVRVVYSSDDGVTWGDERVVDTDSTWRPTEAAAAVVSGSTDRDTRLVLVARVERKSGPGWEKGLMQYVSSDGGATWRRHGLVPVSRSYQDVIPWLAPLDGGRIALVWADRGSLAINVSIATGAAVFASPSAWPQPAVRYRSRLVATPRYERNLSDFGYPSVALGPTPMIVFYDSVLSASRDREMPSATAMLAVPLFERRSPIRLTAQ